MCTSSSDIIHIRFSKYSCPKQYLHCGKSGNNQIRCGSLRGLSNTSKNHSFKALFKISHVILTSYPSQPPQKLTKVALRRFMCNCTNFFIFAISMFIQKFCKKNFRNAGASPTPTMQHNNHSKMGRFPKLGLSPILDTRGSLSLPSPGYRTTCYTGQISQPVLLTILFQMSGIERFLYILTVTTDEH